MLLAQKTGLDYLQRLIQKSKKDFGSNAMIHISKVVGLPHLANPPAGLMVPSVPQTYVDKCNADLASINTFTCEAQASLYSKVRFLLVFISHFFSCIFCILFMLDSTIPNDFLLGKFFDFLSSLPSKLYFQCYSSRERSKFVGFSSFGLCSAYVSTLIFCLY